MHVVAHYLLLYLGSGSGGGYIVFSLGGVLLQACCLKQDAVSKQRVG